jgi:hypothetical protein
LSTQRSTSDFAALARELNSAVEREDREGIREVIEQFVHPEIEWVPLISTGVEGGYRGHDGMARFYDDFLSSFSVTYESFELHESGPETLTGLGTMRLTGKGSGATVEQEFGIRLELEDGMVRGGYVYPSHAEALAAEEVGNA